MTTIASPLILDYAQSQPLWRRRRVRLAFSFTVLIASAFTLWKWGPAALHEAQYRYADYRSRTHLLSPDTIVYEEDPARAAVLLQHAPYVALRQPNRSASVAAYVPGPWKDLLKSINAPNAPSAPEAILFLHERTSPGGKKRIVAVHCDANTLPSAGLGNLTNFEYPHVVIPRAAGMPTLRLCSPMCGTGRVYPEATVKLPPIRFYAGQPDPNDPSRFTIVYELPTGRGTIDGQLTDSEYVSLVIRDGPAKDKHILYDQS